MFIGSGTASRTPHFEIKALIFITDMMMRFAASLEMGVSGMEVGGGLLVRYVSIVEIYSSYYLIYVHNSSWLYFHKLFNSITNPFRKY